jgi:hypothetical protein
MRYLFLRIRRVEAELADLARRFAKLIDLQRLERNILVTGLDCTLPEALDRRPERMTAFMGRGLLPGASTSAAPL